MLPADQRDKKFCVGTRKYDPDNLGFENRGGFVYDTALPGNSNWRHEYGTNALLHDPALVDAHCSNTSRRSDPVFL